MAEGKDLKESLKDSVKITESITETVFETLNTMSQQFFTEARHYAERADEREKNAEKLNRKPGTRSSDEIMQMIIDKRRETSWACSSIISSAIGCEAYINEFMMERIDEWESLEKLGPKNKWIIVAKMITGKTFDKGKEPFQSFSKLIRLRNDLVHFKTEKLVWDPRKERAPKGIAGELSARNAKIFFNAAAGMIRTIHEFEGSGVPGWVDSISKMYEEGGETK